MRQWVRRISVWGKSLPAGGGRLSALVCVSATLAAVASGAPVHASGDGVDPADASVVFEHPLTLVTLYDYALVETAARSGGEARTVSLQELAERAADSDVVFVGELHGHNGVHLAQAELAGALAQHGVALTLSFEQFTRDVQPVLDAYLAGEMGEAAFIEQSRAWDSYRSDYRPLVELAKERGLPAIAANAPRALVRCVGQEGPAFLKEVPDRFKPFVASALDLSDSPYRRRFLETAAHGEAPEDPGAPSEAALRRYAAQVTWDATMAESIAAHLRDHSDRTVMHVNGRFHSAGFLGTVERLERLAPARATLVITTHVVDDTDGLAADPVRLTKSDLDAGDYLLLVKAPPKRYLPAEMQAAHDDLRRRMSERPSVGCPPEDLDPK